MCAGDPDAFGLDAEAIAERSNRWTGEHLVVVETGVGQGGRWPYACATTLRVEEPLHV